MATNNSTNVSTTRGVKGGYFFVAPAGTALPADNKTALNAAFKNMGYCGDSGVVFSDSSSTTTFRDLNGDAIGNATTDVEKSFKVSLREVKAESLKVIYGASAVTDASGKLTVKDSGPVSESLSVVMELLLSDGRKWRRVVPLCKVSELGDMTVAASELAGREVTFKTLLAADANEYYVDYIDSTETSA